VARRRWWPGAGERPAIVARARVVSPRRSSEAAAGASAAAAAPDASLWLYALLLFALSLVPFLPALGGAFLTYDDDAYVSANRFVLQGLSLPSVRYAFTTFDQGNYHPLTWLSLMLDAQLFGASATGFHLSSLLLHAANAVLLLLILRRAGAPSLAAALGALLWAVHPLRVESAAWISERKDVLSATFGLLAIHAYLGIAPGERSDRATLWRVAPWMLLSLLCKATFVTLPALLLLLDFWPRRRLSDLRALVAAVVEKWPLWLLALSFSALAMISQRSRAAMMDLARMPAAHRFPNALVSYGRYVGATLWPSDLAAFYPFPVEGWPAWQWLGTAIVLVAVSVALWSLRDRWPSLLVGWAWYLVALLPVSGAMQTGGQALADRFTYVPTIGFLLAAVGVLPALAQRARRLAGAVVALLCVVLAVLTWRQCGYWRDTVTLMDHTVSVTGFNLYAQSLLAHAHMARGENEQAQAMYEEVLRHRSDIAEVHVNLGVIAAAKGDYPGAIQHYQDGIAVDGRSFEAYNDLAAALLETGRSKEAVAALTQALQLKPQDPDALFNLGMAYAQTGDLAAAARVYEQVIGLTPGDAEAHYRLGVLRSHLGDRSGAEAELERALALQHDHAAAADALRQLAAGQAVAPAAR
jgi:Flp pilus assembly protein TadD